MTTFETQPGLHPNVLYMIMAIERKIAEFESVNLAEFNTQLQAIERQRESVIASINQVRGAIQGGLIMIEEELKAAGATREQYEEEKAFFLKELEEAEAKSNDEPGKVIEFPEQGQEDADIHGTTDDSGGRDRD